jgi:hypothetical protein
MEDGGADFASCILHLVVPLWFFFFVRVGRLVGWYSPYFVGYFGFVLGRVLIVDSIFEPFRDTGFLVDLLPRSGSGRGSIDMDVSFFSLSRGMEWIVNLDLNPLGLSPILIAPTSPSLTSPTASPRPRLVHPGPPRSIAIVTQAQDISPRTWPG